MPAKISEYQLLMYGTDKLSAPMGAADRAVDHMGKTVDTFAGRLAHLRREASQSGELGAERLIRNPERLLGLLTGQGLALAVGTFAVRELGHVAESTAEELEKIHKGTENISEGLLNIGKSVPILGEVIRLGDSIGKIGRMAMGEEDPEEEKKRAEEFIKRMEEGRKRMDEAQSRLSEIGASRSDKDRSEIKKKFDDLAKENTRKANTDADAAEADVRQKYDAELRAAKFSSGDSSSVAAELKQQRELEEKIDDEVQKARALAMKPYQTAAATDERARRDELLKSEGEVAESQMKSEAARYEIVKSSEDRIRQLRTESNAALLESLGFTLTAKLTQIGAEAEQKATEIKKRLGMAMEGATQSERIELGQQMNHELDAVENQRAAKAAEARQKDRDEIAATTFERYQRANELADHQRSIDEAITHSRIASLKEEAAFGDPAADRMAKLLEIQLQYKEHEQELRKLQADGNATLSQRFQIEAMILENRKDGERALRFASQPGYSEPSTFNLDTNVGASFYAQQPERDSGSIGYLSKVADNTDPKTLAQAMADAFSIALKSLVTVQGPTTAPY